MSTHKFLIAALLLLAGIVPLRGQDGREELKVALADLGERYGTWMDAEVIPQLEEWKAELDRSMSAEDMQLLNTLRSEAHSVGAEICRNRKKLRQAWRDHSDEEWQALYRERRTLRDKMMDITDQVAPLAVRYRETLEAIAAKARPIAKDWRRQGRAILSEWREEYRENADGHGMVALREIHREARVFPWFMFRRAVRFMLWDGRNETIEHGALPDSSGPDLD